MNGTHIIIGWVCRWGCDNALRNTILLICLKHCASSRDACLGHYLLNNSFSPPICIIFGEHTSVCIIAHTLLVNLSWAQNSVGTDDLNVDLQAQHTGKTGRNCLLP